MATASNQHQPPHFQLKQLKFRWIPGKYAVCRLPAEASLPDWTLKASLISLTRTADEFSLICPMDHLPPTAKAEGPWACIRLEGPFAFSEVGILAAFINPLAENGIPILAISTYDTDYVLVREDFAGLALAALQKSGHELLNEDDSWRDLIT